MHSVFTGLFHYQESRAIPALCEVFCVWRSGAEWAAVIEWIRLKQHQDLAFSLSLVLTLFSLREVPLTVSVLNMWIVAVTKFVYHINVNKLYLQEHQIIGTYQQNKSFTTYNLHVDNLFKMKSCRGKWIHCGTSWISLCHLVSSSSLSSQEAIQLDGEILFALLKRVSPVAHRHLKKYKIDPILYMTEWFMCAFSRTLPWASVLRMWDMFFCEGETHSKGKLDTVCTLSFLDTTPLHRSSSLDSHLATCDIYMQTATTFCRSGSVNV